MTLIRDIVEGYTGIFDFQKRCCYCFIIQKNRKADHNSYEYINHRRNIKCRTCRRIGHSMRFCRFNQCRVCKKEGYIESNYPMKVKTIQVIEKFIEEKRNNEKTTLTSPLSLKQQKKIKIIYGKRIS